LEFNNTGLKYNTLEFDTATYKIDEPIYRDATITIIEPQPIIGYAAFAVTMDKFNVSISSPFDYTPKNDPEFKGDAKIDLFDMTANF